MNDQRRSARAAVVLCVCFGSLTALVTACRGIAPHEATQAALADTRALVRKHVPDAGRAEEMIAIIGSLEKKALAYEEQRRRANQELVAANADPATTREQLEELYARSNAAYREAVMTTMTTHMALAALATPQEWALVSRPDTRIGGR